MKPSTPTSAASTKSSKSAPALKPWQSFFGGKVAGSLSPRGRNWGKWLGMAVLAYTVFGFFILPTVIKWQMRKQLPALTHRAARVDSVRVNPYALSFSIRGLALTEPDGSAFVAFSNFYVNFEALSSLVHWTWTLGEVQLGSPYGYAAVLTNGQFNFSDLLTNAAPATNTATAGPPPRMLVKSLVITNGSFAVADFYRADPFRTTFAPVEVRLTNFTTRPRVDSPYAFTATTGEGEAFSWAGDITAVPPASSGRFELSGIDLRKYGTYLHEFTQLDVRHGRVTVGATYSFALQTNGMALSITNGAVSLTNLQVFAPGTSNALVSIPHAAVRGAQADLGKRTARIASVETSGGNISARRLKDGVIELLQLVAAPTNRAPSLLNPPVATNAVPPAAPTAASPFAVAVNDIRVTDYAVRVRDEQTPAPAELVTDSIDLHVTGLSLASNAPLAVRLSARVNNTGQVQLESEGTVLPLVLTNNLNVTHIDLRPFQPYVEQQGVKLAFTSGSVSTTGRAELSLTSSNTPVAAFAGDVVLDNVAVIDQIAFQDFAKWKQVAVRGIAFSLAPMSVKVGELFCDELVTSAVIATNGQIAALAAMPASVTVTTTSAPPATVPAQASQAGPVPFPVQVDLVSISNASVRFADLSLHPNCRFAVQQFSGTVRGLSSALNTAATVDIAGRVDEASPFFVAGRINPLVRDLLVDLVISNRNTELTGFTPYAEKFAGHPLQKGKLTVGLKYLVQQQALDAQNVIFIDQLTLGPRNSSPDAIKLPVKLGVALLKDRNGRIELDVPVKGRLDDPKFAVGPIIWHVIENLLIKAATSPFSLLGALVGGGEELSYVEFAPGDAAIAETESAKIEKLSKALYERPALSVEITGSADESRDRAALGWAHLLQALKAARMAEIAGKASAPTSAEEIVLDPRDYSRLLKAAYKKTFNRDRPTATALTNAVAALGTNAAAALAAGSLRNEPRAGAALLMQRDTPRAAIRTNAAPSDARSLTRPATLPTLALDDLQLAAMEVELHGAMTVTDEHVRALKQARAQSVQRALLKTERVTADRLFIMTPKPAEAAAPGQCRVTLALE